MLYCPLQSCEKWKKSLEPFWRKVQKNTTFQHLIPYNTGLRIFSEKSSGSNDGPYCSLHLWKKVGKFLEPFCRKGPKSKKKKNFSTLKMMDPIVLLTHAKKWKVTWSRFWRKGQKSLHSLTGRRTEGMTDGQGSIYGTNLQSQWVHKY